MERKRLIYGLAALLLGCGFVWAANEGTIRHTRTVTKGDLNTNVDYTERFDVASAVVASGVQSIGTTAEALDVGDVSSNGRLFLRNLDATNYVTFGPDDGGTMKTLGRLKAGGDIAEFRLNSGVTIKLQANTAACNVQYELLSD